MDTVHVFLPQESFADWQALYARVHPAYTPDGDAVDSAFMAEVGFGCYEPGCIECIWESLPKPLSELLAGTSYYEQWRPRLPAPQPTAACAVCVFSPNVLLHPERGAWPYVGAFAFDPDAP